MNETEKINHWTSPKWHVDFGNPELEIDLLRSLCLKINELGFDLTFELDCYEEGYMAVKVFDHKKPYFDIQVVSVEDHKFGLFFENGDEAYLNDLDQIKNYL